MSEGGDSALGTLALAWIALASLVGFALMALDKARARRGRTRVPERRMLLVAWLGGAPGVVAAALLVRHKTRKPSFLLPAVAALAVHALVAAWLAAG